jgi:hypothetical protein
MNPQFFCSMPGGTVHEEVSIMSSASSRKSIPTKVIAEIGVAAALSWVLGMVRLFKMPQGGSVSLEMVPILYMAFTRGIFLKDHRAFAIGEYLKRVSLTYSKGPPDLLGHDYSTEVIDSSYYPCRLHAHPSLVIILPWPNSAYAL